MSEASVLPPQPSSGQAVPWDFDGVAAVEIVTPDEYCASLLVAQAVPLFPAEILSGPGWIVRFEAPSSGGKWIVDLLALVECWLSSVPLPCAKASRDGRSYLIRDPTTGPH